VPTETVYGLAVAYDNEKAIEKLMKLKDRAPDSGKKLPLMLADSSQIGKFAIETDMSKKISGKYFPGELTLEYQKNPNFKNIYYDNFTRFGIRIPNHDFMLRLLKKTGPLMVTSANLRGEIPAQTSDDVIKNLPEIDATVIGVSGGHPPSTVAEIVGDKIKIHRQGSLII